jgi:hypothetical protein
MTVAATIALSAHKLEYFVCVEGVGWLTVESSGPSFGFDGDVFATADLDGTLASKLGCTVHMGLELPDSLSDSMEPETMSFDAAGLDFRILDVDDWWRDNFQPLRVTEYTSGGTPTETLATTKAAIDYGDTTIQLQIPNPGGATDPPEEGDVVWVSGFEAILLGARSVISGGWSFASCTRGYLGTTHGSYDPRSVGNGQFTWGTDITVYPMNPFWFDRRVTLWAHVPGEAVANCVRLYTGRIRTLRRTENGNRIAIGSTAETVAAFSRVFAPWRHWYVQNTAWIIDPSVSPFIFMGSNTWSTTTTELDTNSVGGAHRAYLLADLGVRYDHADFWDQYGMVWQYVYRTVPGGTEGAFNTANSTPETPQAETHEFTYPQGWDTTQYMINSPMKIGDRIVRAMHKGPDDLVSGFTPRLDWIVVDSNPIDVNYDAPRTTGGDENLTPVRFLLGNLEQDATYNRFTVNNTVRRNIIDVALIFLTSMPNEFFIGDAVVPGSTASSILFSGTPFTGLTFTGYAVHCVEGANKGEARVISESDVNSVDVSTPFTSAPANGDEYQIRNSIYDVLPLGWGMAVHNSRIDIDGWEDVRDVFCAGYNVGEFITGAKDGFDIWSILQEGVFKTYNLLPYTDRATGQLKLRYIGQTFQDGLTEDYIAITDAVLLPGSLESFEYIPRSAINAIELYTRARLTYDDIAADLTQFGASDPTPKGSEASAVTLSTDTLDAWNVRMREGDNGRSPYGRIVVKALFNSRKDVSQLIMLMHARLYRIARPPPETKLRLDIKHLLDVQAGSLLSVTTTKFNATDPYANEAGGDSLTDWTNQICRVVGTTISMTGDDPHIEATVQVLGPVTSGSRFGQVVLGGKIAPATTVTGKGTVPDDHFDVDEDVFVDEPSGFATTDYMLFAVGDRIELRSITGAYKEGPLVIASFGSNEVADPTSANTHEINVTTAISSTIVAGDYVTFSPWITGTNTDNMEDYVAFADATDEELGASDLPRVYV